MDGPPVWWQGQDDYAPRQAKQESTAFEDHDGRQVSTAYYGWAAKPGQAMLIPLWSFQAYATFPDADTAAIASKISHIAQRSLRDGFSYRVDVVALPGAMIEACIAHYLAEKRTRERTWKAITTYDCGNYLIYVDKKQWEEEGVSLVRFDDQGSIDRQMDHAKEQPFDYSVNAEEGFSEDGEPPNLGLSMNSIRTFEDEDPRYEEALEAGAETWPEPLLV